MKKVCGMWNSSVNECTFSVITSTPAYAIDDDERGVGRLQGRAGVLNEDIEAGSVEEIDFGLLPFGDADSCRDGQISLDFFIVEIGHRVPFIRPGQTVDCSGCIQKGGSEHRFPAMPVAHNTDIANVLAFVDFQWLGLLTRPHIYHNRAWTNRPFSNARTVVYCAICSFVGLGSSFTREWMFTDLSFAIEIAIKVEAHSYS